jgi:soluble lytic murein transglycosylase-like protein
MACIPRRTRCSVGAAVLAASLGVTCAAHPAHADIVRLSNGRIMNVEMVRFEGESVVLVLHGGEIRAPRDLVAELLPDEVPFARTVAIEALASSAAAAGVPLTSDEVRALVERVAARVGLNPRLAQAVVHAESNYQPLAVSPRGAMGLMQIMPVVVRQYAVADPFDPAANLEAGMRYLQSLMQRFPDLRRALAAYNAGESAVVRYGGVPPYRETEIYVRRVMDELR